MKNSYNVNTAFYSIVLVLLIFWILMCLYTWLIDQILFMNLYLKKKCEAASRRTIF